jgi:hypothetical protein
MPTLSPQISFSFFFLALVLRLHFALSSESEIRDAKAEKSDAFANEKKKSKYKTFSMEVRRERSGGWMDGIPEPGPIQCTTALRLPVAPKQTESV